MRLDVFEKKLGALRRRKAYGLYGRRKGFWGAIWLLVAFPFVSIDTRGADFNGPGCVPGVDTLAPSFQVPCDYVEPSRDKKWSQREAYYRFAWNTFFALNWRAMEQEAGGSKRGMPDKTAEYSATKGSSYMPVWDTWRGKEELFRIEPVSKTTYMWSVEDPGVFNSVFPSSDPNSGIRMCPGERWSHHGLKIMNAHKITNLIDETDEINLAVVWQNTSPTPDEESLVRYQVKFNAPHWNYIRDENLYQTAAFTAFTQDKQNSELGAVNLPASSNSSPDTGGSILTKSAWIMLPDSYDNVGEEAYYATQGLYYLKRKGQEPCFKVATFGLIALHVIRKTEQSPFFFFSTFEHTGNYPDKFYYANTVGPSGEKGTKPASILRSGYGIPYENPKNPVFGIAPKSVLHKYQAKRLIAPSPELRKVNKEAYRINRKAGSVWRNYRLVGIQHTPGDGRFGEQDPDPTQDFFLANPVLETNQRFQFFDGKFSSAAINNVATQPDITPAAIVNMGGCMGCHGVAQLSGADFSFSLASVASAPTQPSAAETLAGKCQEINLVFSPANSSCVRKSDTNE